MISIFAILGFSFFSVFKNLNLNNLGLNLNNLLTSKITEVNKINKEISPILKQDPNDKLTNPILPYFNPYLDLPLDFIEKINQNLPKMLNKIKVDENQTVNQYTKEVQETIKRFNLQKTGTNLESDFLFDLTNSLANIKVPKVLYSFHSELIKNYYLLALSIDELKKTNDPLRKTLLYNYINDILNKNKLQ